MEWIKGWRDKAWSEIDQAWDVIVIGGGITGAGILRQCIQSGLKAVLLEANDFASGTSSRSSKLVHGGLRYLKNAQFRVTFDSVREREYLLKQGRGLVNRLGFLYPCLSTDAMPGWVFGAGLVIYDLMARQWGHRSYDEEDMRELCPLLTVQGVHGGFRFFDAQTDDARLVLRLLHESVLGGGLAINYAPVTGLLKTNNGQVCGVRVKDTSGDSQTEKEIQARVVINACGAWADKMRKEISRAPRLRPLRGSHLVFLAKRVPLTRAVSFLHPRDGRYVFALPWEGVIVYGTTDVDQGANLLTDPAISQAEAEYLLDGLQSVFPKLGLTNEDVNATFAGIRPVVDTGKVNPSKESREHVIWDECNLLTVSGGKLTTFRIMAREALKAVRRHIGALRFEPDLPILNPIPDGAELACSTSSFNPAQCVRMLARYGASSSELFNANEADLQSIAGTVYCWAELQHAAREEAVVHLDDLLLRRIRLGLVAPNGGMDEMPRIHATVQKELGWSDTRWEWEESRYSKLWLESYHIG